MRIEKWHEMSKRHKEERRQIIEYCKAHKMTQKDAAAYLGISLSGLNKYIKNNGIRWDKPRRQLKTPRRAKPLAPDAY
jgi:DNA-binding NtrC family response regulator